MVTYSTGEGIGFSSHHHDTDVESWEATYPNALTVAEGDIIIVTAFYGDNLSPSSVTVEDYVGGAPNQDTWQQIFWDATNRIAVFICTNPVAGSTQIWVKANGVSTADYFCAVESTVAVFSGFSLDGTRASDYKVAVAPSYTDNLRTAALATRAGDLVYAAAFYNNIYAASVTTNANAGYTKQLPGTMGGGGGVQITDEWCIASGSASTPGFTWTLTGTPLHTLYPVKLAAIVLPLAAPSTERSFLALKAGITMQAAFRSLEEQMIATGDADKIFGLLWRMSGHGKFEGSALFAAYGGIPMISYPLTPPSTPAFNEVNMEAGTIAGMGTEEYSGSQHIQEWGDKGWLATCSLPSMSRTQAEAWLGFLLALRGPVGTFLLGDPLGKTPRGKVTGTPKVDGNQTAGSKTLAMKGWTPGTLGILEVGDYLQVGNHLYKVIGTDAVSTNGSGQCSADIFPRLRAAVSDDDTVVVNNTKGLFRLNTNSISWKMSTAQRYGISFSAMEAF